MAIKQISPIDAAWLLLESPDTPMHVGGLLEFSLPEDAPPDYLRRQLERMREPRAIPAPWNLRPQLGPLVGARLPLMRETRGIDLDYHVRHSALPNPGGQRELGILVSRLHSHPLDPHRPLWEMHLIEGLEQNRFALYLKIHHALIDGVSGMRLILRALSPDPDSTETPAFWTIGPRSRSSDAGGDTSRLSGMLSAARGAGRALAGLSSASIELARAAVDDSPLHAPFRAPSSALGGHIGGARRFATQQYELEQVKALAKAADCTLNDVVLYLCATALRHYLSEHARLPDRPLTAGIPVNLREEGDERVGTAVGMMIAELGTNIADPLQRLEAIKRSTAAAKGHLRKLPPEARSTQAVVVNGPYITGLVAGLGGRAPIPFNLGISNVPGPPEPLYFSGSRLDAVYPVSLLLHGSALNITCVSYAGTLNFGLVGARDTLPHLQRLAIYMGQAVEEISAILLPEGAGARRDPPAPESSKASAPA